MQDLYIGDIGDFGKYGLLREIERVGFSLAVNWYRLAPEQTKYLSKPDEYRGYDAQLFDILNDIVTNNESKISKIEKSGLLNAVFFSEELCGARNAWHKRALECTKNADIVYLDPDTGLETEKTCKNTHVRRAELCDYYNRGQSVILYQHRPQGTSKADCVKNVMEFNAKTLRADSVNILEFHRYINRYYFLFVHNKHKKAADTVCTAMAEKWRGMCEIVEYKE